MQEPTGYWEDFSKQKIIFQEIQQEPSFALDLYEHMVWNTWYIIVGEKLSLLISFLNSSIINFAYKRFYSTQLGSAGVRWLYQHIIELPIPQKIENKIYTEDEIYKIYSLTDEEINFISSSFNQ